MESDGVLWRAVKGIWELNIKTNGQGRQLLPHKKPERKKISAAIHYDDRYVIISKREGNPGF